jgi:hypothetical protein
MTSVRGKEMLSFLPDYYATSRVMSANMESQGKELDALWQALDGTLEQYFVSTATWGLEHWENELGITVDASKPIGQRRSVILSKMRGIGTVTVSLIKSVAEAYDGGTVDVTLQSAAYTFTVKFVDTRGIPPNLDDLKAVIEEIKPAHLAVEYAFTYTQWSELKQKTWGELSNFTWGEVMTRSWS